MALHIVPNGEQDRHVREGTSCPCQPSSIEGHATVGSGRNRTPYRGVIVTHQKLPGPVMLDYRISLPPGINREDVLPAADPEVGPEAGCGHIVVEVRNSLLNEVQHHDIPDDSAPHSTSSKCGCGPQRSTTPAGHVVYEHADQRGDAGSSDLDDEGV